jgi:ATP-binding cassette subfamily C (CFTR/MRP) protein 1
MMLNGVITSPVSFFDTTPIGRIVNRFTSDTSLSDESLATNMSFSISNTTAILGNIGSICYTTKGVLLAVVVPLVFVFVRIKTFFTASNTELKRLDSISRSPIFAEFNQSIIGVSSLKAYAQQNNFIMRLESSINKNSRAVLMIQLIKWWLMIRLDAIAGCVSCFVAGIGIGIPSLVSVTYLSMSLNMAFSIASTLKYFVTIQAEVEASLSSVERIRYYAESIDCEETEELRKGYSQEPIPTEWPQSGAITAENLEMKYKSGPLILKNLNFDIKPSEHIGIVGRTGCGKSSLMVSLFRIENLCNGSLTIDGIDISKIPLSELRSRVGIIPQDPVMFSFTVRFNLDPFNSYSDVEIWSVLEAVAMKSVIQSLPLQLDELVTEGGDNFSAGQKQLICIARVLLRKPKVLVLDEATASVDNETDELIQKMVRERFKNCTVLTIAHRLHTVIDSDRIMVLNAGKIEEFDAPQILLENKDGIFTSLWKRHLESHEA